MKNKEEKEIKLLTNQEYENLGKSTKIYYYIGIAGSIIGGLIMLYGLWLKDKKYSCIGVGIALLFILIGCVKSGKKKSVMYEQTSDWCFTQLEKTFGGNRDRESRQYIESIVKETKLELDWDMLSGDSFKYCEYKGRKFFIVNYSLIKETPSENPKEQSNFSVKEDGILVHCPIDKNFSSQKQIDTTKLEEVAGCEVNAIAKTNFVNVFIKTETIFCDYGHGNPKDIEGIRATYMNSLDYMCKFLDAFFENSELFTSSAE